jgi:hypothetical protein
LRRTRGIGGVTLRGIELEDRPTTEVDDVLGVVTVGIVRVDRVGSVDRAGEGGSEVR